MPPINPVLNGLVPVMEKLANKQTSAAYCKLLFNFLIIQDGSEI